MKKYVSILLVIMLSFSLCACGGTVSDDGKLSVVTTIFPEYDWTMNILGDRAKDAEVTMLLDSGVDLHSYSPSADDLVKISTCDVFIYVGGESDEWVKDALKSVGNENMIVINLMEVLGDAVREEETVEGMEKDAEEEGETEYDEHIWLSLRNAGKCCEAIADKLGEADAANAAEYAANAGSYTARLNALDDRYADAAANCSIKTLLFADRFPFRYLADDYGLDYYAAFSGCSAESEASFETVAFLADKVNELGLKTVLTLEGSDSKIALTVIDTAGSDAEIMSMDSMQSVTSEDVKNGADYIGIMEKNLEVLTAATGE